ncbi:MAG TPA: hypothetical protein VMZ92_20830 [Planctomycetota bacterium]|nr:hypothetical protein [Planctomycetota bacterium]
MAYDFEDQFDRADGHNFLSTDVVPGPWDTESFTAGGVRTIVSEVATFSLASGQAWSLAEDTLAAVSERWCRCSMRWDTKTNPSPVYFVLGLYAGADAVGYISLRAPAAEAVHWQTSYRHDGGAAAVVTIPGIPDPSAGQFYEVEIGRRYSSGVDAGDGKFYIFIDRVLVYSVTDIDDDTLAGMDVFKIAPGVNASCAYAGRFDSAICHTSRIYPASYPLTLTDQNGNSLSDTLTVGATHATGTVQRLLQPFPYLTTLAWTGGTALTWQYRAGRTASDCRNAGWVSLSSGSTGMSAGLAVPGRHIQWRIALTDTLSLGALTVNYRAGSGVTRTGNRVSIGGVWRTHSGDSRGANPGRIRRSIAGVEAP